MSTENKLGELRQDGSTLEVDIVELGSVEVPANLRQELSSMGGTFLHKIEDDSKEFSSPYQMLDKRFPVMLA